MNKTVSVLVRTGTENQALAIFSLMNLLHKLGVVWVQQVMDVRPHYFRMIP